MPERYRAKKFEVFTIGHSTHPIAEFVEILKANGIKRVIDIRTIPRSRHNPQFNGEALAESLRTAGIGYTHIKKLGGLRHPAKDSINLGWRNSGFRGFADYMQTPEFEAALERAIRLAKTKPSALMCAEAVPWRCHRSLVADALTVRKIPVHAHLERDACVGPQNNAVCARPRITHHVSRRKDSPPSKKRGAGPDLMPFSALRHVITEIEPTRSQSFVFRSRNRYR